MVTSELRYRQIFDISVLLGVESIDYPEHKMFTRKQETKIIGAESFRSSHLSIHAHAGTHLDAPAHLTDYAKTLDQYDITDFILPTLVVNIEDKRVIRPSELEALDIHQGDAVLFRTDNSMSGRNITGTLSENYVYMSVEAAEFCVERMLRLVGFDYFVPEKPKGGSNEPAPIHRILFENDILILEGANLRKVSPGRYIMFCLPLKMKDSEGSPVRAILMR